MSPSPSPVPEDSPDDGGLTERSKKFYDGTYNWDSAGFKDENGIYRTFGTGPDSAPPTPMPYRSPSPSVAEEELDHLNGLPRQLSSPCRPLSHRYIRGGLRGGAGDDPVTPTDAHEKGHEGAGERLPEKSPFSDISGMTDVSDPPEILESPPETIESPPRTLEPSSEIVEPESGKLCTGCTKNQLDPSDINHRGEKGEAYKTCRECRDQYNRNRLIGGDPKVTRGKKSPPQDEAAHGGGREGGHTGAGEPQAPKSPFSDISGVTDVSDPPEILQPPAETIESPQRTLEPSSEIVEPESGKLCTLCKKNRVDPSEINHHRRGGAYKTCWECRETQKNLYWRREEAKEKKKAKLANLTASKKAKKSKLSLQAKDTGNQHDDGVNDEDGHGHGGLKKAKFADDENDKSVESNDDDASDEGNGIDSMASKKKRKSGGAHETPIDSLASKKKRKSEGAHETPTGRKKRPG